MASNSKQAANAQFKKAQRAQKAGQARPQYETDARVIREKMETGMKPITKKGKRSL